SRIASSNYRFCPSAVSEQRSDQAETRTSAGGHVEMLEQHLIGPRIGSWKSSCGIGAATKDYKERPARTALTLKQLICSSLSRDAFVRHTRTSQSQRNDGPGRCYCLPPVGLHRAGSM